MDIIWVSTVYRLIFTCRKRDLVADGHDIGEHGSGRVGVAGEEGVKDDGKRRKGDQ